MEISRDFAFEASHVLPNHPGKCANLHGHSWKLIVAVEGEINKDTGMVMDYAELKRLVQPIVDDLDHSHLGAWKTSKVIVLNTGTKTVSWLPKEVEWNPTSENLLLAIAKEINKVLKFSRLQLLETENTCCYLEREVFLAEIRKENGI